MFAEDLAPFLDVASGFAVDVTVGAVVVPVVFDNGYQSALGGLVESTGPTCIGKTSDLAASVQGTSITINGTSYTVTAHQPDGTGMTTLQLRG